MDEKTDLFTKKIKVINSEFIEGDHFDVNKITVNITENGNSINLIIYSCIGFLQVDYCRVVLDLNADCCNFQLAHNNSGSFLFEETTQIFFISNTGIKSIDDLLWTCVDPGQISLSDERCPQCFNWDSLNKTEIISLGKYQIKLSYTKDEPLQLISTKVKVMED